MSYENLKIKDSDISTHGVIAAPDRLSGTAQENKAVFDRLIKNVVAQKFNSLLEQVREDIENIEVPPKGEKGDDGADGYTPIKGVDYWTEEDKAEIKDYVDEAAQTVQELLWENASPTSSFAEQTVKLDLSRYRKIYIEFSRSATTRIFASAIVRVGEYNYLTSVYIQSVGAPYIEQRQITVQEDGISFSGGRSQNVATTSGYTTVNDVVIPCYIYGIKGVS